MKSIGSTERYLVVQTLEHIAWLLNLRCTDIECNPFFTSFLVLDFKKTEGTLYVNKVKITEDIEKYLKSNKIFLKDYDEFYSDLSKLSDGKIIVDKSKVNYRIIQELTKSK